MFNDNHDRLSEAAKKLGHEVISWDDFWWENGNWPSFEHEHTIFHGSLGNASRIASELSWNPGVFCNTSAFEAFDYGCYYEDKNLPIVITPVSEVGVEWRFVITGQKIIASSSYEASNRTELYSDCPSEVADYVKKVAMALFPPDPMYILDVCIAGGNIKLIEINPFSGADLYACDRQAVVSSVEGILEA